jgi:type VI secretion system protein ImpL
MFGFPHQFSLLRDAVTELIAAVFLSTRFDRPVLLRGVYFTSGTQERTPIDRLLGAMSRRFGVAPEAVAPPPGKGKAYFIERLLRDVIIGESGLAGFNLRFEAKQAAAKLGAYVAIAAVTVLAVSALWISYGNNRAFVANVDAATARLDAVPPSPKGAPLDHVLPRLDAIRRVSDEANRYRDDRPWLTMGWGLYEGNSVGDAAREAYSRELNGVLLRTLKERFEAALREHVANPQALFLYLKGYLMLGFPERLDADLVGALADREWQSLYRDDDEAANRLSGHFRTLLKGGLRPVTLDERLVAQARRSLPFDSVPMMMYSDVKQRFADDERALPLDRAAGIGAERVFRRKSGVPLSQPLEAIYTKAVFKEITTRSAVELVAQFSRDQWVWGEDRPLLSASAMLRDEFIRIYEDDYIKAWDSVIADLQLVPLGTLERTKDALATLGGEASPLRTFLKTVDENTYLTEPPEQSPKSEGIKATVERTLGGLTKKVVPVPAVQPGLRVTQHFAKIRQLLTGEGGTAKLDGVLEQIRQIQQKLEPVGKEVGQTSPDDPKLMASIKLSAEALTRSAAPLPPSVGNIVRDLGNRTASVSALGLRMTLEERYQEDVVQECRVLTAGHYPFFPGGEDLPLADFARLFGSGGLFDTFFRNELADLVDKQDQGWAWKPGVEASVPLEKFYFAEQLRRMFFPQGAATPGVTFTITPSELDDKSRRFVLEIDGQVVEYAHGAERMVSIKWPGDKVGSAVATFEEHTGARSPIAFEGAWAWFRLLDAANLAKESEVRYSLTLASGGHKANLRIDAHSVWNPFRQLGLLKFRC